MTHGVTLWRDVGSKREHPEDDLQKMVCEYLDMFCPVKYWAVPNGGKRNRQEAARMSSLGVKAGVWDLHFCIPPNGRLAVLELKIKPNNLTDRQKEFGEAVRRDGALTAVAFSFQEALDAVRGFGITLPKARVA